MNSRNPNIDRYALMRDEVMGTFKFTPRSFRNTFIILGLVPLSLYYLAEFDINRWDLAGKKKGESLLKYPKKEDLAQKSE
ncbi:hypothetical protein BY996DRAFT_2508565 [Phakopsora pachyrhizi]|uniref:Complex I-B15 n=1 Tax=Phakopsora pachyrhizi TaxID=170000 RepID=A0AAV0ASG9_PHAPC|nr:hypothetical protein BY996DRAFT_2508565 [Phakopsora pachyrhizi]CAH7670796.1 hypothetical protein PPACK8108_LOCUS5531 [Phakopsora pachyrhizi]